MRWLALIALISALGGCTYEYPVTAFIKDGRLAFRIGGSGRPPHVNRVEVEQMAKQPITVWQLTTVKTNGSELREVTYGKTPPSFGQTAPAHPLEIGRVYTVYVDTTDGGGFGKFAISESGEILQVSN
jgi:hypothetical protein